MMVDAALLAILAWAGLATLPAVVILTFGQGLAFAFNGPAWQSYIPSLVPPEAMVNAIALNSAQFSLARVIGPAIGGVLIIASGPGLVFGINAGSYITVLVALSLIRSRSHPVPGLRTLRDLLAGGIRYTWHRRRIRTMIATIAVQSFFGAPVTALLPIYTADVYGRGATGYGTLAAAIGVGSVLGALLLGRLGSRSSPGAIAWSMMTLAAALLAFALIPSYGAGLALLVLYGAAYLFGISGTNSDIQLQVDESVRGRVLSIYMLAFGAFYPVGSLVAGLAAERFGAPATTATGATVCLAWGLWLRWWWRRFKPAEP
jgi:predicted MFS family arabinose efflux permease